MPSPVMHKFPRYKLFIYGEGRYAEGLRSGQLGGLPVLFIPGNAGSYRQVRSLGSVALRTAESLRSPFHFNMFSVDLNEELSGIYGGVLSEQIEFVHECIQHIRKMYKKNVEIILVGHSMGGVLARAVFVHEGFNYALVPLIFTQASPHIASLASFDSALQDFFTRVNDLWGKKWNSTLNHVSVVSISGGERDILVQSDLTQLIPEANSINSISVVSTAVPGVWASTDHLCIVWCKQLVMTTVRALFDVVDLKSHTILQDLAEREKVLKYHFIRKYGEKHFVRQPKLQHQLFPSLGIWILKEELSWHFSKNKVLSYNFILVPLFEGETIIVVGDGLVKEDWVFACSAVTKGNDTMSCHEGENLSNKGALILSRERKTDRKCFQYPAKDLLMKGHSHLLVQISPSNKMVHVIGERYKEISRNKTVRLPSVMRNFLNFGPTQLLTIPLSEGAVFYKLFLSGLQELWQAYSIIIETRICRGGALGQGLITFVVPWSHEDKSYNIRLGMGALTRVTATLQFPKPAKQDNRLPQLHIILDPECSYNIRCEFSVKESIGQFIKYYGLLLPGYMVAIIMFAFCKQLQCINKTGLCPSLLLSAQQLSSFVSLVIIPVVLYYCLRSLNLHIPLVPSSDDLVLQQRGIHFFGLRFFLYLIAYGLVILQVLVISSLVILFGALHQFIMRKFSQTEVAPSVTEKKPTFDLVFVVACSVLAAVSFTVAGGLGLIGGFFLYLFKLTALCGKNRAVENRRGISAGTTRWHFHNSLYSLWLWAVIFTIPSLVVWVRNIEFSSHLTHDPHLLPSLVIILACSTFWQKNIPSSLRWQYGTVSYLVHAVAVLTVIFGLTSMYRIFYFISVIFAAVSVQQAIALCQEWKSSKID